MVLLHPSCAPYLSRDLCKCVHEAMDGFGVQLTIIHRYSATLRWIIVLVYTKLVNSQRQKKKLKFIWSKLGWKADYSRLHFILQTSRYLVDISRTWVANQSALVWYILNQNKLACQGQLYPEQHGFRTYKCTRDLCGCGVYFGSHNSFLFCRHTKLLFQPETSLLSLSYKALLFCHPNVYSVVIEILSYLCTQISFSCFIV